MKTASGAWILRILPRDGLRPPWLLGCLAPWLAGSLSGCLALWISGSVSSRWLPGTARGGKTNYWLDAGPPQRRKVDRFQGPGGVPGGLWGGSGVVFLDFFRSRGAGNQKSRKNNKKQVFSYLLSACFLYIFLCCLASWSRRRRESGP